MSTTQTRFEKGKLKTLTTHHAADTVQREPSRYVELLDEDLREVHRRASPMDSLRGR